MQAAKQSNVDYAVQAKSALAAVERLTAEIEAVPQKTSMCREKWRDYGAALLAQRVLMPSNQKFGQWVKVNGLDKGIASNHQHRSDAMWLADNYDIVIRHYNGDSHHPQKIRQACREAGHAWAGETKHQKERKKKSVRTKAKQKRYSWSDVAADEGLLSSGKSGGSTQILRNIISERWPEIDLRSHEHEEQLRTALRQLLTERKPDKAQAAVQEVRETVKETARDKFDRAVKKATDLEIARLQSQFFSEIEARVAPAVEQERARAQRMFEESQQELERFIARRDGVKQAMNKKELQLVLNCLHPDRAPEDRRKRFAEAFNIVKRLQPYVESFKN